MYLDQASDGVVYAVRGSEEVSPPGRFCYGLLQASVAPQYILIAHLHAYTVKAVEYFPAFFRVDQHRADSAVVIEVGAEVADAPEVSDGQVAAAAQFPGVKRFAALPGSLSTGRHGFPSGSTAEKNILK